MTNFKTPGRPRLYETASAKVDAFRKRQESSGYLRKEILVTARTWERLSALAIGHGVGVADAASGLLEFGLDAYSLECGEATSLGITGITVGACASSAEFSGSVGSASKSVFAASQVVTPENNPISNFFSKRKDSSRG